MSEPRIVAGTLYRPGEGWEAGWFAHDGARIVDEGTGAPPAAPEVEGVVLPALVNAHTHVGDRVGRGVDLTGRSLSEVVAPPRGLKHRLLRETPRADLVAGMRAALGEMAACGTRAFLDFRELGAEGVRMLREAAEGAPVRAVAFGRVRAGWSDEEAAEVLALADGYGLSALGDVVDDTPERAARLARRLGKRFALHFSEARREDVARALDLAPDFLVHVCEASSDDLAAIAAAGVPIVTCPRSNALFGRRADVAGMLARSIPVALGTDNAMFHPMDMLAEMRALRRRQPALQAGDVLDIAIAGGARVAEGTAPRTFLRKGDDARHLVLAPQGREAEAALFGDTPPALRAVHLAPTKG